jgi:hypothetical protein
MITPTDICANLAVFCERSGRSRERWEGFHGGGGGLVARDDIKLNSSSTELVDDTSGSGTLRITFMEDSATVEAATEAMGLPRSWAEWDTLTATMRNGSEPVVFQFIVLCARGRMIAERALAPGEEAELSVDLRDVPLGQGMQPAYEPSGIRFLCKGAAPSWTEGERLCVTRTGQQTAPAMQAVVDIVRVALTDPNDGRRAPVMDRFGQRIRGTWPTKLRNSEHMAEELAQERAALAAEQPSGIHDAYGGWTEGPRFPATGFFRVEQDDVGRWWFVTPEGNPFWSIGTTGVRTCDCTVVTDREFLFEELPPRDGEFEEAYNLAGNSPANRAPGKDTLAFYRLNVLRKYGTLEAWRDHVCARFRSWGFNTFGNWSEEIMLQQQQVVYTRPLTSRAEGAPLIRPRMPDVWDPEWEAVLRREVERETAAAHGDPWLLGYFCDNEMPWGSLDPADAEAYAEKYFETVNRVIKEYDPDHLYLGCRFVRNRPSDQIVAAAGRHCDVVTVNSYDLWPRAEEFGAWHAACGRPILIGEHHTPLFSPRQVPPLYPAFTDEERERLYVELVRKWAVQPYSLGCHWFQHADQHITGRPIDGENQPVGFVDIADQPYPSLVRAAREATSQMYQWHMARE